MKSQKEAVPSRESFLIGCEAQNIYKIFIKEMGKIEKLRNINFMEDDQSLATYLADEGPSYYFDFISKEENKLLPIEVNNLSDSNNKLSPIHSDIEISLRRFTKTRQVSDKYGTIAQYLAMSTLVHEIIYEPLTYNKALHSTESAKWQDAMQQKYNAFVKNHTWDKVFVPDNQKILKDKWVYKLKISNIGIISRYKARWVAKDFEQ